MREPLVDIDVNCKGTIYVLEAIRRFNREAKLVHVGTSTQIGRMHTSPIDEWHSEFPLDIYSANKSASEKYVMAYGAAYGMRTTVIRLANTYGPRSNIRSPDFGFMNFFIGLALQGRDIHVFGRGRQLRNVNYVNDVVDALLLAASKENSNGHIFFAVGSQQLTVSQIAEAIVQNIGGKLCYVPWPKDREVIEIGDAVISNAKISAVLSWQPSVSIDDGLVRTRDYFATCMKHYLE
jgi:UDP-glucose 4-epimerase